jgi:hypothetical protein
MNSLRIIGGPTINQIRTRTNRIPHYNNRVEEITNVSDEFVTAIKHKKDKDNIASLYIKLINLTKSYTKNYTKDYNCK